MKRIVFLTAAVGSMVLVACADSGTDLLAGPQSHRAATANDGRIAFASSRGGRWTWPDIYLANGDGTGVRRLTVGTAPADGTWFSVRLSSGARFRLVPEVAGTWQWTFRYFDEAGVMIWESEETRSLLAKPGA